MKYLKITTAALLCSLASLSVPTGAQAAEYVENQDAAVASSVRVVVEYSGGRFSYGTGWVIAGADDDLRAGASIVVTALHVLQYENLRPRRILILLPGDDEPIVASVSKTDRERDLAFLEVKNLPMEPLRLSTAATTISQEVGAVGYTGASDRIDLGSIAKTGSFVPGAVSRLTQSAIIGTEYSPRNLIQHSVPLNVGFSGGPLVDKCGRVVGVNLQDGGHISLGGAANVALAQGVGMAISADEVLASANSAGFETTPDNSACGEPVPQVSDEESSRQLPCGDDMVRGEDGTCVDAKEEGFDIASFLTSPQGIIALVALLGLLGAGFALFRILKPGRKSGPVPVQGAAPVIPPATPTKRKTISLIGTGPDGEAINLTYDADIGSQGKRLGTEAPDGLIPDNRSKRAVSRFHATLSSDGSTFSVTDEKATNKTKVNGNNLEPHQPRELRDGDTLSLADVKLKVSIN